MITGLLPQKALGKRREGHLDVFKYEERLTCNVLPANTKTPDANTFHHSYLVSDQHQRWKIQVQKKQKSSPVSCSNHLDIIN